MERTIPFTPSSASDWKNIAEKAKDDLAKAKATIGELFLERAESNKRIMELEAENENLRRRATLLEAKPVQISPSRSEPKRDGSLQGAVDRVTNSQTRKNEGTDQADTKYGDTLSVSEVVNIVNSLNEEIFQAAAHLSETLVLQDGDPLSPDDLAQNRHIAGTFIGGKLTKVLLKQARNPGREINPLLSQVALQVFLSTYCTSFTESWYPDVTISKFLSSLYREIRTTEEQALSGTWRAVTRMHGTRMSTYSGRRDDWLEYLITNLNCVLRTASWSLPSINDLQALGKRIEPIFDVMESLRNALGEKVTSTNLEVLHLAPDQPFQPSYMENLYADPGSTAQEPDRGIVMGTTGLGLKRGVKDRSRVGKFTFHRVVSAKVILESTLLEALEPAPPRKKKSPRDEHAGTDRQDR